MLSSFAMHRVTVERSGGIAAVIVGGEVDAYGAPELEQAFSSIDRERGVVVDLDRVSFLDSTALGVVVRAVREHEERGGDARVVLPRGSARRIFEITTLDAVLPVEESREQAVAALTATASGT
jgi:anti-sigma B factor antagonist